MIPAVQPGLMIANERRDRLELLAQVVVGLGHEAIAREVDVTGVAAVTARERAIDVTLQRFTEYHNLKAIADSHVLLATAQHSA